MFISRCKNTKKNPIALFMEIFIFEIGIKK